MKARPILMSTPMVQALLEGSKTQTRRLFKDKVSADCIGFAETRPGEWTQCWRSFPEASNHPCEGMKAWGHKCPYGKAGDLLWVREAAKVDHHTVTGSQENYSVSYKAGGGSGIIYTKLPAWFPRLSHNSNGTIRYAPGIHMPRWASRLTLEITSVRVEMLKAISEMDAYAEGIDTESTAYLAAEHGRLGGAQGPAVSICAYAHLWDSINGLGSWDTNPWVWVLDFKVHHSNVDVVLKDRQP